MSENKKPSWDDAPPWATWLAQDLDGAWYWYEVEPYWSWIENEYWDRGERRELASQDPVEMGHKEPRP